MLQRKFDFTWPAGKNSWPQSSHLPATKNSSSTFALSKPDIGPFELLLGELEIPRGFNRPPALLKLDRIRFVEMSLGIALHVHGTELNRGVGKQALGDGEEPVEIVLHQQEDAAQAALDQVAQDGFPVFQILAAGAACQPFRTRKVLRQPRNCPVLMAS